MYLNLKPHLIYEINKIDLLKLKRYDENGNVCFYLDNCRYYPKVANLNELIGVQLAKELNLRTVDFMLFEDTNHEVLLVSKSFINPYSTYHTITSDNNNFLNNIRDYCVDDINFQVVLKSIFKMFAIDIYMGQTDRGTSNLKFEKYDTRYFDLAPLYDYSEAQWDENISYKNPLYNFNCKDDYDLFFSTYPSSLEFIKKIKEKNIMEILRKVEYSKSIKLPQEVIDIYSKREENTQKKLEKIIK